LLLKVKIPFSATDFNCKYHPNPFNPDALAAAAYLALVFPEKS
jgi:hypothetical protein